VPNQELAVDRNLASAIYTDVDSAVIGT
jgi:hypothetical protein